jgi:hypothetical protein
MNTEAYTVVLMPKKTSKPMKTRIYPVRHFPLDLLQRMQRIKQIFGTPVYVQIRDAVREKLDREHPEKETH